MTPKEAMHNKFDNLDDLNLTNNLLILQEAIKNWCELKPQNKELQEARDAIVKVSMLTNKLQLDRGNYHIALSQYRSDSTRSIVRARKAEERIEELEQELKVFKKAKKLGL